jgi:tRNA (guanine37-N1)-methyltransferase
LIEKGTVAIMPYKLELDYDSWTYAEIAASVLPQNEEMPEVPQGFTQVGHVCTFLPD